MTRTLLAVTLSVIVAAGCQSNPAAEVSRRNAAKTSWNVTRAGVLYSLARNQFETGNFDACRRTLDEALLLAPASVPLHILSARLHIELGKLDRAEAQLAAARNIDPKNAEIEYLSGIVRQRWQRPQEALECYERAAALDESELAYLLARTEMLVVLGRRAEAQRLLRENLARHENSAAIRDALGQMLMQDRRYADAAAVLRQAVVLAPDETGIREHFALALYYTGEYAEAAVHLERLLRDEQRARRADLHMALGECRLHLGDARAARESLETAIEIQPFYVPLWLSLTKTALALNDLNRADLALRKALALDAGNAETHLILGCVRLRQNRLDEALAAFRKAAELQPSDPVAVCMIGYALESQGRTDAAIEYYGRALQLNPDDELASTLLVQARRDR